MQRFLQRRLNDGISFVILMIVLGGFAISLHIDPTQPSYADHFILQAQAWLHGRLDVGSPINDSIVVGGKFYILYPPLPAILMLPFVAILGHRFSDIWFTWAFAAFNIILLFRTLEVMRVRGITNRTVLENRIIALTFGFGTIALWLCLNGDTAGERRRKSRQSQGTERARTISERRTLIDQTDALQKRHGLIGSASPLTSLSCQRD